MDLPDPGDANAYYHNYADPGDPHYTGDGYATAYGAKISLVLTNNIVGDSLSG